jgi:hypothetical protein
MIAALPQKLKRGRKAGKAYVPTGRPPGHPKGRRNLSARNSCATCRHPEVERINYLACTGNSLNAIAAQFGVSYNSIRRHADATVADPHIKDSYRALAKACVSFEELTKKAIDGTAQSLDEAGMYVRGHTHQWALAREAGDHRKMVMHSREARLWSEHKTALSGELLPAARYQQTVNMNMLVADRGYTEAIDVILRRLLPYPEARQEVIVGLSELDRRLAIADQRTTIDVSANDD